MIDAWILNSKLNKSIERFVERVLLGKISADKLTIIGLILGLLSAFFIFLSGITPWTLVFIILATIFIILSFTLDGLDGALERLEYPTIFGGILDMFCDRTVEVFVLVAVISTNPEYLMWPGIFSLCAIVLCITIFLAIGSAAMRVNLDTNQKLLYYARGIMERAETFIFLLVITIFFEWRIIFLWIFAVLVFLTAFQRLRTAYLMFQGK
jgi:phosphatidylglycerophosphate synthase